MNVNCPECGASLDGKAGEDMVCPACLTPFVVSQAAEAPTGPVDVQLADGRVLYALNRWAVRESIYVGRIGRDAKVRQEGGAWQLLGGYPEFAAIFRLLGEDLAPLGGARKLARSPDHPKTEPPPNAFGPGGGSPRTEPPRTEPPRTEPPRTEPPRSSRDATARQPTEPPEPRPRGEPRPNPRTDTLPLRGGRVDTPRAAGKAAPKSAPRPGTRTSPPATTKAPGGVPGWVSGLVIVGILGGLGLYVWLNI
jgi:hypothetical protein